MRGRVRGHGRFKQVRFRSGTSGRVGVGIQMRFLGLAHPPSHGLRPLCSVATQAHHFDDRTGPLYLCGLVSLALTAIFIICAIDFYEVTHAAKP